MITSDLNASFFAHKTVLVTGAAGFLGSHLVDKLLAANAIVIGVDNFMSGRKVNLDQAHQSSAFSFITADVSQSPLNYLPQLDKLDLVLHFASLASPPHYQQHPMATYLVNSMGTHNLLQYLYDQHPRARFLFASTSEVYGDPQLHPQPETYWGNVNPNGERSCYDEGKRLGETICGVHHRTLGMDVRIVRIFNTYGPRINPLDRRVIPDFIQRALQQQPMQIYGDGGQTRSYCYVDDLVRGILLLAAVETGSGKTINLGNPEEHTVMETAQIIQQLTSTESISPQFLPARPDDPHRRQPDISLARELLDWEPKVSFVEGLKQTIAYMRANELA